jgi:hypothetical protein
LQRTNETLVNQEVNATFLDAVSRCPSYEKFNYRQIGDGMHDAFADVGVRHFRIVIIGDSFGALKEEYGEELFTCIGELPPFDTIWILSGSERCGLVADTSAKAKSYAGSYTAVMIDRLAEERGCSSLLDGR